jgi:iron complex transport system permease protein
MKGRFRRQMLISLLVLLGAVMLSIAVGSVFISPVAFFKVAWAGITHRPMESDRLQTFAVIIGQLRLPRTFLMLLVGAALGGSGASFQGLFRNPLADPYLIGVASGAGLGAVAAIALGLSASLLGMFAIPVASFLGAVLTIIIVYELARIGRTVPITNLILSGVAVSAFATALTSFLMLNAGGDLRRALVWLLGGSTLSGWLPVLAALPYILLGLTVQLAMAHPLNVVQFGDEQAQQLGVNVGNVRLVVIAAATLSTAAAISFAGIIGFVGLIVPHLVRLLAGSDHRRLLPLSMLGGASLLLISDVIARVVMAPQELPVGIITALAGAPFFFWVLRTAKQQNAW